MSVSRCVVTGNLITNEWLAGPAPCGTVQSVPQRGSFLLDDRPPLATAEISVMGNVFQGSIWISPLPDYQHSIGWHFFNSVTV